MLTAKQKEYFFEVGFIVEPDVFTTGEVRRMRSAFERLEQIAKRLRKTQIYGGSQFVFFPFQNRQTKIGTRTVDVSAVAWKTQSAINLSNV